VVNRSQSRISLAYFFAPRKEAKVAPLPDLVRNDKKLYKTFTIEEYLAVKRGQLLNTLEHFEEPAHEQQMKFSN
jgi:isopenicillin N synthase-like dioxygenase